MKEPFVVAADEGRAFWHAGGLVQVMAMPDTTGRWGISVETYPAGFATPLHVHHRDDGAFYILEGHMRIVCAGIERVAGPGELVFLPAEVAHAFRVEGDGPARWLSIQGPEGDFMRVAEATGQQATELRLPVPADGVNSIPKATPDSGIERLGPPPFGP
jgi:mannose-6-phosphate isomerase-like protein (cupin superfamily)